MNFILIDRYIEKQMSDKDATNGTCDHVAYTK